MRIDPTSIWGAVRLRMTFRMKKANKETITMRLSELKVSVHSYKGQL